VEISFCDARLCAIFNSYHRLCESYGQDIAHSIRTRMGVLLAAPNLAAVSRKPPIGLRAGEGTYTVSLAQARRLRFQAGQREGQTSVELENITAIEILGVDG
jgi:hypothetical protein